MINLSFSLRNPFSDRWRMIKCWSGQLSTNKYWEVQIDETADLISGDFRYTMRQDHAGLFLSVGLVGYEVILNIYDHRHWDQETNDWVKYD